MTTPLTAEVHEFLVHDADLLDRWSLNDWLELWADPCEYLIPPTDRPDGDPATDLFFVRDDRFLLEQRVEAILGGTAWAESPRSITHRMISNVSAETADNASGDELIEAKANVLVHRSAKGQLDVYPAFLNLTLARGGSAGFLIRRRVGVLALDQLRPHGRLSILL